MAIIKNIRQLKDAAVLAERKPATPSLELKRFNLFYGFNGAGKSTLSRVFATLQHGKKHARLPDDCTFEIEMDDGTKYTCPKSLGGIEKRVCVFNQDFIAENLRWEDGNASPIFYIGADQADAAEELKKLEVKLPTARAVLTGAEDVQAERDRAFREYKKLLAADVARRLRQSNRYEATQLTADFKAGATAKDKLTDADLDALSTTSARTDAPAKVAPVEVPIAGLLDAFEAAIGLGPKTIGAVVVGGLDAHPEMVPWVKAGHEYHVGHDLKSCLYCGETISFDRRELLSRAFDDELSGFITAVSNATDGAATTSGQLDIATAAVPAAGQLSAEFQPLFEAAATELTTRLEAVRPLLTVALNALKARQATPTTPVEVSLPPIEELNQRMAELEEKCEAVNAIIGQHAAMVDDFADRQVKAREAIRRHFVAISVANYTGHEAGITDARAKVEAATLAAGMLETEASTLRAKVQQHSPAADKINALVKSYLGHSELTIQPVDGGYELHRHGALVQGAPSEGEKTAIALCYFLSALEADNRKVSDLIVVIDDPVSSLDTKAMNYACGLIRSRLEKTAQLISGRQSSFRSTPAAGQKCTNAYPHPPSFFPVHRAFELQWSYHWTNGRRRQPNAVGKPTHREWAPAQTDTQAENESGSGTDARVILEPDPTEPNRHTASEPDQLAPTQWKEKSRGTFSRVQLDYETPRAPLPCKSL